MTHRRQRSVWSSSRGRMLYHEVTKLHVPRQGKDCRKECPGCQLALEMERQMSVSAQGGR